MILAKTLQGCKLPKWTDWTSLFYRSKPLSKCNQNQGRLVWRLSWLAKKFPNLQSKLHIGGPWDSQSTDSWLDLSAYCKLPDWTLQESHSLTFLSPLSSMYLSHNFIRSSLSKIYIIWDHIGAYIMIYNWYEKYGLPWNFM